MNMQLPKGLNKSTFSFRNSFISSESISLSEPQIMIKLLQDALSSLEVRHLELTVEFLSLNIVNQFN